MALLAAALLGSAIAQPAFDSMFRNGAVLQHGAAVSVWGTCASCAAGGTVSLALDGEQVGTAALSPGGSWRATIPPQAVSWSRTLSAAAEGAGGGSAQVEVKFGAVVLCSGQCEYTRNLPLRAVSGSERLLVVAANMGMPLNHWAPCCDIPPAQRDPDA